MEQDSRNKYSNNYGWPCCPSLGIWLLDGEAHDCYADMVSLSLGEQTG